MTETATENAAPTETKTKKGKAPKKAARAKATAKTKTPKAAKPKREKPPRESRDGWGTFALRLPVTERDSLHAAAGPAGASRVMRALAEAFTQESESAFKSIVLEAKKLRA